MIALIMGVAGFDLQHESGEGLSHIGQQAGAAVDWKYNFSERRGAEIYSLVSTIGAWQKIKGAKVQKVLF